MSAASALVRRGAVHTWDSSSQRAQVPAQLGAVMDQVTQYPLAEDVITRVIDPGLIAGGHLPVLVPLRQGKRGKNFRCARRVLVKLFENLRFAGRGPGFVVSHIE